jgi:hypothetical protein
LNAPAPAATVHAALDHYLASNGFQVAAYGAPTYEVDLGDVTGEVWTFPNVSARRRAVPLHDLHHVLTGYGTDVMGEAEIGAWELVAGCTSPFLWWINLSAVGVGLLLGPARVVRAGMRALGQRSLYRHGVPYPSLLPMTVGQLRAQLGMPGHGQADRPPGLHRRARTVKEPPHPLPGPVRRLLRALARGFNPIFGGVRSEPAGGRSDGLGT